jgi:hypothetical protein
MRIGAVKVKLNAGLLHANVVAALHTGSAYLGPFHYTAPVDFHLLWHQLHCTFVWAYTWPGPEVLSHPLVSR